jgi:hypothetical protein
MTVKKDSTRTYVSLSFSCPPEMEQAINRRTVELGFHSRSDYLRRLFERDVVAAGLYDPENLSRDAPPRIRRGRQPKAKKK